MNRDLLRFTISSALVAFALAFGVLRGLPQAVRELSAPSDVLSGPSSEYTLRFVFDQVRDLREIYCSPTVIKHREQRSVCRVDARLVAALRREIEVTTNTVMSNVLFALGKANWNGTQPQIRLISRDQIHQSPLGVVGDQKWKAVQEFLNRPVRPGDIVVFADNE